MSDNLVTRLPDYYQSSPPVSELERALGTQAAQLMSAKEDTLSQLWVETATWGLDRWEQWCGLPTELSRPYSWRRQRILAKLLGQGVTTAELIAEVVASFGFYREQVSVVEHCEDYTLEIILSDLAQIPTSTENIADAVNEIKPAHLDWYITYEMSALASSIRVGTGFWTIREVTLPNMGT